MKIKKLLREKNDIFLTLQSFLLAAVHSRNIHRFRLALLLSGASPDRPDDEDETLTIFEKCCQTPGYSEFVRECIRWGCDVNKVMREISILEPINFLTLLFLHIYR